MVNFIFEHSFYFYLIGVVINFVIGFLYKFITKDFNTSWDDIIKSIAIYSISWMSFIIVPLLFLMEYVSKLKIKPPKYL